MIVDVSDNELLLLEFYRTMDVKSRLQVMKQAEKYAGKNENKEKHISIHHSKNEKKTS